MLRLLPALLAVAVTQTSSASFEREGEGARIAGLGGAGLALAGDPWGFLLNPACSPGSDVTNLAFVHVPSPYGLRELSRSGFIFVTGAPWGTIAASGTRFGFDLYRELSFRAAFGTELAPGIRAGVALEYYRLAIQRYGSASTIGADFGFLWIPTRDIQIGFSGTNVNAPVIGRSRERLPQTVGVGGSYAPAPGLLVLCDIVKDIRYPAELRFGIEYSPVASVALRAGAGRDPATYGGGVGIQLNPFLIDYSVVRHEALGFTHRFGLMIRLGGD